MVLITGVAPLDIVLIALACFLVHYLIKVKRGVPKGLRLPPGPKGKPIIGNLEDMPTHHGWETITRWGEQYGELVYVKVLGSSMVFVNTLEAAVELFEKRSSRYSDRHDLPMMMMLGWDNNMAFIHYGQMWRRSRKTFHQFFNQNVVGAHQPVQLKHARALLRRMNESPDAFVDHMKYVAASIIMEVVFSIKVKPQNDRYIEIAHKALEGAAAAANPGAFLVDVWPILRHVPEWMPGAGFKKKARIWRESTMALHLDPFMTVKKSFLAGTAEPCVTASCLADLSRRDDAPPDEEDVIRNVVGGSYAAGAGTSVSALTSFILAMVLYPETQRKAQEELDAVIGDRLPTFDDRAQLPYVNALCIEVQRWRPVLPLGVAHAATEDDVFGNYFIPKGCIIVGNAWAMLHNEATYGPRPEQFEPERFLKPGAKIPSAQYGFGRRICPGRHLAANTLFIVAASMLKTFNITHARNEDGQEIHVEPLYTSGVAVEPEPFRCSIKPRSESAKKLIPETIDA